MDVSDIFLLFFLFPGAGEGGGGRRFFIKSTGGGGSEEEAREREGRRWNVCGGGGAICVKWVPFVKLAFLQQKGAFFGPKMGQFQRFRTAKIAML